MEPCGNQTGRSRHLALFFCQGERSVGQGILEHEIRVPPGFWGKIWSLGNKKSEFAAHESLMDSGKTIDFHLSHLMFPPSYGWKDLFNLRCVFLGSPIWLWFVWCIRKSEGVSSLVKRYGSSWASSWGDPLRTHNWRFASRPQLTTENVLEKLTLMSMTQSGILIYMWTFQWCQQSQGCSHWWGHVSTVWSIYAMLGYIPMVPMISEPWRYDTFERSAIFMVRCHWIWML